MPAQAQRPAVSPDLALLSRRTPQLGAMRCLSLHWPEYLMEAALLGSFMVSACVFGVLYEFPGSPVRQAIASPELRRLLMGLSMGATAVALIYSPWGQQSGAHMNPAVTLTFFRLGKLKGWDAFFYAGAQFLGAVVAVALVSLPLRSTLADPSVRYVVTVPGPDGPGPAFVAEFCISAGMIAAVLRFSGSDRLSAYTGLAAGALVATYITLEAPISGMSINPARSLASAVLPQIWDSFWIYLTAPPLGMLAAAELHLLRKDRTPARCAKLHHTSTRRCIFCGANGGVAA